MNEAQRIFAFGKPQFPGNPQQYAQHPVAQHILRVTARQHPQVLTFWGVGLTDSDRDLLELYWAWAREAECVEMINPSAAAAERAERHLGRPVRHYCRLAQWDADLPQS